MMTAIQKITHQLKYVRHLYLFTTTRLPEKLGKLIAELHFLKLIRSLVNRNVNARVQGCLIDKQNGIIHCRVTCNVCLPGTENCFKVEFVNINGVVTNSILCESMQLMTFKKWHFY